MFKEILPSLRMMAVLTVLTGLLYPAFMTAVAHFTFPVQASGSLVTVNGQPIGSTLIGQYFTQSRYFHPRPSLAGSGYDATASGGSNLGPTSAKLLYGTTKLDAQNHEQVDFDGIALRLVHYCIDNALPYHATLPLAQFNDAQGHLDDVKLIKAFNDPSHTFIFTPQVAIPADAVTASASGLDPEISPANAELQIARIARARKASPDQIRTLVAQSTERAWMGLIGEPRVNVLRLNLALDKAYATAE